MLIVIDAKSTVTSIYAASPHGLSNRTNFRRFLLWPVGPFKKGPIIPKHTVEKEPEWKGGRGVRGGSPQIGGSIREQGKHFPFIQAKYRQYPYISSFIRLIIL